MMNNETIIRPKTITEQVHELLRERITRGVYTPDERMPSEERLAEQLQVSRATVRTALAALSAEGLVRRRHGDGTYPTPHAFEIQVKARDAWDIWQKIEQSGRKPAMQMLEAVFRQAGAEEAEALHLNPGEQVFSIHRLFLADAAPVMLAVHVVRTQGLVKDFPPEAAELPLLQFIEQYHQSPIGPGQVAFKAVPASPEITAALQVETNDPVLRLESTFQDQAGEYLFAAWEYYRGLEGFSLPVIMSQT